MPEWLYHPFVAGVLIGYALYDSLHFQLHFSDAAEGTYFKKIKKEHMMHHYKNAEERFGITSKIWDLVFGTMGKNKEM